MSKPKQAIFRKIGGVTISSMSPVQVTCLIEQHLEETAKIEPGGEGGKFKITSGQLPVYFRRTSGVYKNAYFSIWKLFNGFLGC